MDATVAAPVRPVTVHPWGPPVTRTPWPTEVSNRATSPRRRGPDTKGVAQSVADPQAPHT
ncbi:hypothetical protein [Ornithinimicrobium sp. CNJ-824]|uniref:hypothetical protein n=1 Tax=Ornithinimicrobium sp. CNJ-824 TaxID=1904966 RepID=UPI00117F9F3B|nr:hypothetical protein [Ornithinimicrobium sp. CNJ-824]